jgi:hypothetical protein
VPTSELERGLSQLEAELKRLEAEYNMFFAGRLNRPPWETRSRVESIVKQFDRAYIQNTGDRFRFHTLQSRYAAFVDLWDRSMRAREEGRAGVGPAPQRRPEGEPVRKEQDNRVLRVTAFTDPSREQDKLADLYEALAGARRELGESQVSFRVFSDVVKGQVEKFRQSGSSEVAFRVAVQDGKVTLTAKGRTGDE